MSKNKKPRVIVFSNGDAQLCDAKLLKKYPFLAKLPTVKQVTLYASKWPVKLSDLDKLTYSGERVQLGKDGGIGLKPEQVTVRSGEVIEAGDEFWTSDMTLLEKKLLSENTAKRIYKIQGYPKRYSVYLNAKKRSVRYYLRADLKKQQKFSTINPGRFRKEQMLKKRFGVTQLPARWESHSTQELAKHFELQALVREGKLAAIETVNGPFQFLNQYGRSIFVDPLRIDVRYDRVSYQKYCSPTLDMEKMKSVEYLSEILENREGETFLFLYLYNRMGNDFLELLADILKKKGVDFHQFM